MVFLRCKNLGSKRAFILRLTHFLSFPSSIEMPHTFKALSLCNNTHILLFLKFLFFFFNSFYLLLLDTIFVWLSFVLPQLSSPNTFPQIWDKFALNHDALLQPKEGQMEIIIQLAQGSIQSIIFKLNMGVKDSSFMNKVSCEGNHQP